MNHGKAALCAAAAACLSFPAAAQAPDALASSSRLTQDSGKSDSWTYRNPRASIASYTSFIIEPTVINSDPSGSWGKIDGQKRHKYAQILTEELRKEIGSGYQIVDRPGPNVGRMKITLLGVDATNPVAATASKATPMGLAFTSLKSLRGKKGNFMGSVHAAFELTDSRNGEIQFAAIRKRSPNALDIGASLSTENTVEAVAKEIANAIRKGLDSANGR